MHLVWQAFLLFSLNLLDAVLTIVWVRNGIATESNEMMASLLDIGDLPFLAVKIFIGCVFTIVMLYWGDRRVARFGMTLALAVYVGLMGVHLLTGLYALGYFSGSIIGSTASFSTSVLSLFC